MFGWKKQTTQTGFTIVELLIVIVVIGILAAITIVAYNGIQTRAENMKTVTAVKQYVGGLKMYAVDHGHFPIETGWPCLGPYPETKCGNVTDATSACIGGGASSRSDFDATMKDVFNGEVPQPSTQVFDCNGKQYSGAWYHTPADGSRARITYYLRGDQPCDQIGDLTLATRVHSGGGTGCSMQLSM